MCAVEILENLVDGLVNNVAANERDSWCSAVPMPLVMEIAAVGRQPGDSVQVYSQQRTKSTVFSMTDVSQIFSAHLQRPRHSRASAGDVAKNLGQSRLRTNGPEEKS